MKHLVPVEIFTGTVVTENKKWSRLGEIREPSSEVPINSDEGWNQTVTEEETDSRDVIEVESVELSDQMNGRMLKLGEAWRDSCFPAQVTELSGITG